MGTRTKHIFNHDRIDPTIQCLRLARVFYWEKLMKKNKKWAGSRLTGSQKKKVVIEVSCRWCALREWGKSIGLFSASKDQFRSQKIFNFFFHFNEIEFANEIVECRKNFLTWTTIHPLTWIANNFKIHGGKNAASRSEYPRKWNRYFRSQFQITNSE